MLPCLLNGPPLTLIFRLVYVDDLTVTGNNLFCINYFIDQLCSVFYSRKLGDLGCFHGMEVHYAKIFLHPTQSWYTVDLLKHSNMLGYKRCSTLHCFGSLAHYKKKKRLFTNKIYYQMSGPSVNTAEYWWHYFMTLKFNNFSQKMEGNCTPKFKGFVPTERTVSRAFY